MLIKLVLPQAAQLGIKLFCRKNSNASPPRGTCFKDTLLRIEEEKSKQVVGIKPTTSRVLLYRPALYCCATTAALVIS